MIHCLRRYLGVLFALAALLPTGVAAQSTADSAPVSAAMMKYNCDATWTKTRR
jgi:hypothetical protein